MNCSLENRTEGDIKLETGIFQCFATSLSLLTTFIAEVTVHPASEAVFFIPAGLPMSHKDECARHTTRKREKFAGLWFWYEKKRKKAVCFTRERADFIMGRGHMYICGWVAQLKHGEARQCSEKVK